MGKKQVVKELLELAKKASARTKNLEKTTEAREKDLAKIRVAKDEKLLQPIANRIFQELLASARANASNGILDFKVTYHKRDIPEWSQLSNGQKLLGKLLCMINGLLEHEGFKGVSSWFSRTEEDMSWGGSLSGGKIYGFTVTFSCVDHLDDFVSAGNDPL